MVGREKSGLTWCVHLLDNVTGGERGIRTLDTLPYTHFPGVRLQPLGHLSTLARVYGLARKINRMVSRLSQLNSTEF